MIWNIFSFFRRKPKKPHAVLKQVVAGVIIGGAIGSIIGKAAIELDKKKHEEKK